MWGQNAKRSAETSERITFPLYRHWTRTLHTPAPAWPESQYKLQFDNAYYPVVVGEVVVVGSMVTDSVTAYDLSSGDELWRYYTNGPVRFAPVIYDGKIYAGSDDGYLYCLNLKSGKEVWKFRCNPEERLVLGNDRMISMWPVRGAPVLAEGKIYVAAGIWPFMGIFIYALDAKTGEEIWCNSSSGSDYLMQQHSSPAFSGVAPQGYLAASKDKLLIAGGRTVPAVYNLKTGKFLYYHVSSRMYNKNAGGYQVHISGDYFFNGFAMYKLSDGAGVSSLPTFGSFSKDAVYHLDKGGNLIASTLNPKKMGKDFNLPEIWSKKLTKRLKRVCMKSADTLWAITTNRELVAYSLKAKKIVWENKFKSTPENVIVANGRLLVSTLDGQIHAFGAGRKRVGAHGMPVFRGLSASKEDSFNTVLKYAKRTKNAYALLIEPTSMESVTDLLQSLAVLEVKKPKATVEEREPVVLERWKNVTGSLEDFIKDVAPTQIADEVSLLPELAFANLGDTYATRASVVLIPPETGEYTFWIAADDYAELLLSSDGNADNCRSIAKVSGWTNPNEWEKHSAQKSKPIELVGGKKYFLCSYMLEDGGGDHLSIAWAGPNFERSLLAKEYLTQIKLTETQKSLIVTPVDKSQCSVIAMIGSRERANKFREHFYNMPEAERIHIIHGTPSTVKLPPYFADVIVSTTRRDDSKLKMIVNSLRPYTGVGMFPREAFAALSGIRTANEDIKRTRTHAFVRRARALKGSAGWTQQNADACNSMVSADMLVKAPLGILWFGGPPNDDVLPRHGHGPSPQVLGGHLYIEGANMLRAVDVYTGRLIWQRELKGIGRYYDTTAHFPGAGEIGGNYCLAENEVYVFYPDRCLVLNPLNGETKDVFTLNGGENWGDVDIAGDYLVVLTSPIYIKHKAKTKSDMQTNARYSAESTKLVVLNRFTGRELWRREARYSFRHNSVVADGGKVFVIDNLTDEKKKFLRKMRRKFETEPMLYAFDIETGKELWAHKKHVYGTWLAYSKTHRALLQAGSANRDRAKDESRRGMTLFDGKTGEVRWHHEDSYGGPPLIHDRMIIAQGHAYNWEDGKRSTRVHPLTGETLPWTFGRNYGCNTAIASQHLITFRSAAAGFYDLITDSGTANLGGFKSGCTANLIVADGVLNAPDYTRTCTCSYQNQASLAMIHSPEVAQWSFNIFDRKKQVEKITRLGVNLGAPGDRVSGDKTLWLEWPFVGGQSPKVEIKSESARVKTYQLSSRLLEAQEYNWVGASGVLGLDALKIKLANKGRYTVKLYFFEPEDARRGERVFDVAIQGERKLEAFDVNASKSSMGKVIVKTFRDVSVDGTLLVELKGIRGETVISGVEIIKK